jgi:hemerythrin-like domain-containing protein
MSPIGLLFAEHRLIEKFISVIIVQSDRIQQDKLADIEFVDNCIDFIKTYADMCHHGKEETILFRDLKTKEISGKHSKILAEIITEHNVVRELTVKLVAVRNSYFNSVNEAEKQIYAFEIYENLKQLVGLYPEHIKKEENELFPECMNYFTDAEKTKILDEFLEFDRELIHKKYKEMLSSFK